MTTWVLLRGLTREAAHWGGFPALLAQAMPGSHIVAIDLPGAGSLWREPCPPRVEAMVESCRRRLHEKALCPPYALLGLSLGGMVAAAWASAWPGELSACVLVNTSMRPFSPAHHRLRPSRLPTLLRLLAPGDARSSEQAVLRLTSHFPQQHAAVVESWAEIRQLRPVSAANALRQLLAAVRYRHPGPWPSLPLLVVSSARDALVDASCSRELALRWRVAQISHPQAGHDLPLDAGPWLAAQIADWSGRNLAAATQARPPAP
jgi:pimeloyl-ACP methyl ester carboxylesterase